MLERHPKKSFKIEVTKNSASVEAQDVTGYDLGLAGIIAISLFISAYIITKRKTK